MKTVTAMPCCFAHPRKPLSASKLSLLCWPIEDAEAEQQILERFVASAFGSAAEI